jgi:hypothetical protein
MTGAVQDTSGSRQQFTRQWLFRTAAVQDDRREDDNDMGRQQLRTTLGKKQQQISASAGG